MWRNLIGCRVWSQLIGWSTSRCGWVRDHLIGALNLYGCPVGVLYNGKRAGVDDSSANQLQPFHYVLSACFDRCHSSSGQSVLWKELCLGPLQRWMGPHSTANLFGHVDVRCLLQDHSWLWSLGAKGVDKLRTQICISKNIVTSSASA